MAPTKYEYAVAVLRLAAFVATCTFLFLLSVGWACSSDKSPRDTDVSRAAQATPLHTRSKISKTHTDITRQGDMKCAIMLARVHSAIANINYNYNRPSGDMPSQKDMEAMAKYLYRVMPRCPRANIVGQEGSSYFVAKAGPTPTTRSDIEAYEVAGNHGSWRHILFNDYTIVCVSEQEWARMRKDHSYRPDAPVIYLLKLSVFHAASRYFWILRRRRWFFSWRNILSS